MKRREFLNCAAAVSAATCAGALAPKTLHGEGEKTAVKCKITVIKKEIHQDLYEKYQGSKSEMKREKEELPMKPKKLNKIIEIKEISRPLLQSTFQEFRL